MKSAHGKLTFTCKKFHKNLSRSSYLRVHESTCKGIITFPCEKCTEVLKPARELEFHQKIKHKDSKKRPAETTNDPPAKRQRQQSPQLGSSSTNKPIPTSYQCRRCPMHFQNRQLLHAHQVQEHYQVGAGLHPDPFQPGQRPWVNDNGSINEGLRDCYLTNRPLILERFQEGPVESLYNIPMFPGIRIWDIRQTLQGICDRQRHAFKVNWRLGL